jgi:hypothetical protein
MTLSRFLDTTPAQIRTGASTHTAPTLDEWRGIARQDKDAEREGLEATA